MIGDIIGSVLGYAGAEETNDANLAIAHHNSAFNAEQAQIARSFNREQAAEHRAWSTEERRQQQMYNSAEAQIARDFSANMSNTAWQRGVRDMEAAGINPMLAFMKGGASTPTASGATSSVPSGAAATGPQATSAANVAMLNTLQHAISGAQGIANLINTVKQGNLIDAQTTQTAAQTGLTTASMHESQERIKIYGSQIQKMQAEITNINNTNDRIVAETALARAQKWLVDAQAKGQDLKNTEMFPIDKEIRKVEHILLKNNIPLSEAEAKAQSTDLGPIMAFVRLLTGNNAAAAILRRAP